MRFLAVDDEKIMLAQLEDMLCRIRPEAEVLSFAWPDDALEAAGKERIDVAFLDIEIGGMTGLELAARLKKVQPDIHIVFVTGYQEYRARGQLLYAGGWVETKVADYTTVEGGEELEERRKKEKEGGHYDRYMALKAKWEGARRTLRSWNCI